MQLEGDGMEFRGEPTCEKNWSLNYSNTEGCIFKKKEFYFWVGLLMKYTFY
jgi:hypothetical protein